MKLSFVLTLLLLTSTMAMANDTALDCNNAMTTAEMNQCAALELAKYESTMRTYLHKSLQRYQDDEVVVTAINASQTAWHSYREAHCAALYATWREGTIRTLMGLNCKSTLTQQRTHTIWSDYLTFMDSTPALLPEPNAATTSIVAGQTHKLFSNTLNEERTYHLYLPPGYEESSESYPVIYLLDGDLHRFKSFTGLLEGLSTATLDNQIASAIVVAVPNTQRARDLTPTKLETWTFEGRTLDTFEQSGQAEQFSQFLIKELMPNITQTLRASKQAILVGESFGGLFASYVLMHHTNAFSDYLIIDPTALWHDNYLNRTHATLQFEQQPMHSEVFFAFANNDQLGAIGITNRQWGQAFAATIGQQNKVQQRYFAEETHGTVALMGWYYGLKFLLTNQHD